MRSLLLKFLTALSLLLCVAMTFACITSYALPHAFNWGDSKLAVGRSVILERGRLFYCMASNVRPIDARLHPNGDSESIGFVIRYSEEFLGVNISSWDTERSTEPGVSYGQHTEVSCGFALPILMTALLPA